LYRKDEQEDNIVHEMPDDFVFFICTLSEYLKLHQKKFACLLQNHHSICMFVLSGTDRL